MADRGVALAVPPQAILIAIGIHALWGGNPVAVKFSLLVFPPLWTAFFRFTIAIVCIIVWARVRGLRFWPSRNEWPVLLALSLLFTIQIATMNAGFDLTSGAMGSVLIATNPIFAAMFAHLFIAGDRLTTLRSSGLLLAMLGAALALLQDIEISGAELSTSGNGLVLLSACLLGLRLSLGARALREIDEVRVVAWQMLLSLPWFALGGLSYETIRWDNLAWPPIAGLLYQGVIVAGVGFMVSFNLMKRYAPSVMMSFNFVSPIAGVLLAMWLLDEQITGYVLAGMLLVAIGLFLVAQKTG
jgi:drug/metabolite transporter (DMT)-like permease